MRSLALACLALVFPTLAAAQCKIETLEMPIKMVGSRAVASVGINGTSVPLTVDSGARKLLLAAEKPPASTTRSRIVIASKRSMIIPSNGSALPKIT